jgi:multidrug resistance efflux pump
LAQLRERAAPRRWSRPGKAAAGIGIALIVVVAGWRALGPDPESAGVGALARSTDDAPSDGGRADWRTAAAVKGAFKQSLRRTGFLKPVTQQRVLTQVGGVILEMAPQGKVVVKDDIVLRLDPTPHEDARTTQAASIRQREATYRKEREEAAQILNQAKEDAASYELRVQLETARLDELKKGATATEVVNAQVNLENARNLLQAKEAELQVLTDLAAGGYASKEELRQKQLDVSEQRLAVAQADIKQRKLAILDPVKLAEQEFKVGEAVKTRDAAKERVALLERNLQREAERHEQYMERERERLKTLTENVEKTVHRAPGHGVVVHRRHRWFTYSVGREVWEGQEVLALPDFNKMKVALAVDEARIGDVSVGQEAEIEPAGAAGRKFQGKVTFVAEKGRDEFEQFSNETMTLSGTANRQVFDVEIELDGSDPLLRPGLRVEAVIRLRTIPDATMVPRTAIVRGDNGETSVRVASGRKAERRPVKILAESDFAVVVDGVQPHERVWVVEPE